MVDDLFSDLGRPPVPGLNPLERKLEEAQALLGAGDRDAALAKLDRLVRAHPRSVPVRNLRAICLQRLGQPVKAAMELHKALELAPDTPELLANLGGCYRQQGDFERARRAYQRAVELAPDFAAAHINLASSLQTLGRPELALRSYVRSLELTGPHAATLANVAAAHLELGAPTEALSAARQCLALDPTDRRAMSILGTALREAGQDEEAARLFDPALVRPFRVESVAGHESLAQFNRALSEHVAAHPSLEYEPPNRSTTRGEQTDNLLDGPKGPVAGLEAEIEAAVSTYLRELPQDDAHPYLAHRPEAWRLNVWGTRLGSQGKQAPHIHPSAWVSGVYYSQLPPEVSPGDASQAGWLEFGRPYASYRLSREHPLHALPPEEGTLVLFPSYFFHRTLPFESETKRVSIAFDAIPVAAS